MIAAVEAVQAVQEQIYTDWQTQKLREKQWIPSDLKTAKTFFSVYDLWHYNGVYGENQCEHCAGYDGQDFVGVELRAMFPDLIIKDEDWIYVNLHQTLWGKDTCKCYLMRVSAPIEPGFPLGDNEP